MTARADEITTPRLRLEPLRADHAAEMVPVLADPALYAFTGGTPPSPAELQDRYTLQSRGRSADGTEAWHNWIVRLAGDGGEAIGLVQATVTGGGTTADIAWIIGVPWQHRGYATEAAGVMVEWLVARGVRTITAHVHPDHAASAGVAARLRLEPTDAVEDGEIVWRREVAGTTVRALRPGDPGRRGRVNRLHAGVGTALIAFALFEVVFVRSGALPAGPDQVVRDVLLAAAGVALLVSAVVAWRRRSESRDG